MLKETPTRFRRTRIILTWAAANLALGALAVVPLLTIVVLTDYLRAKLWGTVAPPFHEDEAGVSVLLIVGVGLPLAVAAILVNRALRRRLHAHHWAALAFWTATALILLAPFLTFLIFPNLSTVIF